MAIMNRSSVHGNSPAGPLKVESQPIVRSGLTRKHSPNLSVMHPTFPIPLRKGILQ
jgi:hypothetical protein